jgi:hypothetical protein
MAHRTFTLVGPDVVAGAVVGATSSYVGSGSGTDGPLIAEGGPGTRPAQRSRCSWPLAATPTISTSPRQPGSTTARRHSIHDRPNGRSEMVDLADFKTSRSSTFPT